MSALHFRRQSNWMVKFWSEAIKEDELYNLDQPMNLSFYQTVVKSLRNINSDALESRDTLYLNNSGNLPKLLSSIILSNTVVTKPLNLNINLNTMFTSLYSADNVKLPKSDEINSVVESVQELCNPELTYVH